LLLIVVVEEDEEHEGKDEEKLKKLVLVVHRYIQWSFNLMTEIISKILYIRKLTDKTKIVNDRRFIGLN